MSGVSASGAAMPSPTGPESAPPKVRAAPADVIRTAERPLAARRDEAALVGQDDGLDAVAKPQLREQTGDVRPDRPFADGELGGELGVALTTREPDQQVAPTLGQAGELDAAVPPWRAAGELLDDPPRHRGGEQCFTVCHDAYRAQQRLGRRVLEQEAAGARPQRLED